MTIGSNLRYAGMAITLVLVACGSGTDTGSNGESDGTLGTAQAALGKFKKMPKPVNAHKFVPRSLDRTPVTVVAQLDGEPSALRQEALGRRLTTAEKSTIASSRKSEQDAVRPHIARLGGRVVGSFQHALNGVKVTLPKNEVENLRALPGVKAVKSVARYKPNLSQSVPRIHAPDVWAGVFGLRGEGVKIAVVDTGIDYTHADFGGPGTVAAWNAAVATSTAPADPALFGPGAPRIKGGIDLAGDAYNANVADSVPVPDSNPLDCEGHGSHVAGIAGGSGVLSDGTTYSGPYDPSLYTNHSFLIGPGVAPKADLYSVRVFGCEGSTNLITEALEWAVANDMDVVNMSLGSDFAPADSSDAEASDNASKAGVVIVAAQGNAGNIRYIGGSPAASSRSIAVAASDKAVSNPGAIFTLPSGASFTGIDANAATFSNGTSYPVKVLKDADGNIALGCDPADYLDVTGKLVVTQRGTCARVDRAIYGQAAGAAAVVMVNTDETLPPFEGAITQNPDTLDPVTVTIPFFGTTASDGIALAEANGLSVSVANTSLPTGIADFSSSGPRNPDASLKPEITAPGVAIISTSMGTGTEGVAFSGTSMATPHIAGVAALTLQAHPQWRPAQVKAAIVNSGDPTTLSNFAVRTGGTGLVNAASAARTAVYAEADNQLVSASFGFKELSNDFVKTKTIQLHNTGRTPTTFTVGQKATQGSPHTLSFDRTSVTVPARGTANVIATLSVPVGTVGDSTDFRDVAGLVTFTPATANTNFGISLTVPYYFVPRATSAVRAVVAGKLRGGAVKSGNAVVDNIGGNVPATADFYAWGLEKNSSNLGAIDLRAAGVQTFGAVSAIAVNTFGAWSSPSTQEFDIDIDADGDGVADYLLIGIDLGFLTDAQAATGQIYSVVYNLATGDFPSVYGAITSTDTSSIVLPFDTAAIGVSATNPRFSYSVTSRSLFDGTTDAFSTRAKFNAVSPGLSTGQFVTLAPNDSALVPLSANPAELALTPALGILVLSPDNKNGPKEALLEKIRY